MGHPNIRMRLALSPVVAEQIVSELQIRFRN
jgi:hypothetical protein